MRVKMASRVASKVAPKVASKMASRMAATIGSALGVGTRPALALVLVLGLGGCGAGAGDDSGVAGGAGGLSEGANSASGAERVPSSGTEEDWGLVQGKARWAFEQGLDSLPMGELVARIGETFIGTPYAARTLEEPGEEHLVVELNELDCVTFVESALAIARLVKSVPPSFLDDQMGRYRFMYNGILQRIRYRGGELDGYPSRLHYFSEWITDNDDLGIVRSVTPQMRGSVEDPEPIDFMTTHAEAYRQLGESPAFVDAIQAIEADLSRTPRAFVPENRIADVEDQIRTGDIIAATSTVEGLDVAHTGIAVWVGDELHLLHAPLTDGVVEMSERPLASRVLAISGQDGIMVARPSEIKRR
jgi:N-acetylmuramoyl-L-alanine amidase-like